MSGNVKYDKVRGELMFYSFDAMDALLGTLQERAGIRKFGIWLPSEQHRRCTPHRMRAVLCRTLERHAFSELCLNFPDYSSIFVSSATLQ